LHQVSTPPQIPAPLYPEGLVTDVDDGFQKVVSKHSKENQKAQKSSVVMKCLF